MASNEDPMMPSSVEVDSDTDNENMSQQIDQICQNLDEEVDNADKIMSDPPPLFEEVPEQESTESVCKLETVHSLAGEPQIDPEVKKDLKTIELKLVKLPNLFKFVLSNGNVDLAALRRSSPNLFKVEKKWNSVKLAKTGKGRGRPRKDSTCQSNKKSREKKSEVKVKKERGGERRKSGDSSKDRGSGGQRKKGDVQPKATTKVNLYHDI